MPKTADAVSAPTLLSPETKEITTAKPIISGVSFNDTLVEIFIDDAHVGTIQVNFDISGTGNFSWKAPQPLAPGSHTLNARAVDTKTKEISSFSETITVTLIPFGTPTVLVPDELLLGKPFSFIEGVAHNNSTVHLFIDGALTDSFKLGEDESGSVGFKYSLTKPLFSGKHTLYVQAEDAEGKQSLPSKVKIITIAEFPAPTLVSPASHATTLEALPTISGIAFNNSKIHISVDGARAEVIAVKNSPSGIGNFSYTLKTPLQRGSYHTIYAQAEASDGRMSKPSNSATLFIEHYFVPPTLLIIKGNPKQPTVGGVAHNGSTINLFVDNKLDTTITPSPDPSGTLYFEAQVSQTVTPGIHKITAQAFDSTQKPSKISRAKYHTYAVEPKAETPVTALEEQAPQEDGEIVAEEPQKQGAQVSTGDEAEGKTKLEEGTEATATEGEQKAATETQSADTEKQEEAGEPSTGPNLPLVLGLIILIGLALLFIVWYLGQKRRLLNEGIDKLFSDEDEGSPPPPQATLFDESAEESALDIDLNQEPPEQKEKEQDIDKKTDYKKPDASLKEFDNDIPPPPPAI